MNPIDCVLPPVGGPDPECVDVGKPIAGGRGAVRTGALRGGAGAGLGFAESDLAFFAVPKNRWRASSSDFSPSSVASLDMETDLELDPGPDVD